ncbi:MAG: hypothetical protein CVU38_07770 [Chloroflexi bacterium HGW-Chloroflexi-1]|nr:MAG: hypothetical protein CVU38_07770 [Chloroflexi bacterium HGW-Chloroflexi-1]
MSRTRRLTFRLHALQRMYQRRISDADVRKVVESGEVIEDYPSDEPYPSQLLLGWVRGRSLHVVVAHNAANDEVIVITVYEPDVTLWESDLRRRRKS